MSHSKKSLIGEDGRWQHSVSQSWLKTLSMCPERGRYELFGEVEDTNMDAGVIGKGMHAGIEHTLKGGDDPHTAINEVVDECAATGWRETKHSVQKVYKLAHATYDTWRQYQSVAKWRAAEVEFDFDLCIHADDERVIRVTGIMDLVDTNGVITDWKQTTRPYSEWEYQRWAIQPTVYTWALDALFGSASDRRIFRYVVVLHDGTVQEFDVWRGQGHWDYLKRQVLGAALQIESGLEHWPMNDTGWWCSPEWCPAWDLCKGADVPVNWKERA